MARNEDETTMPKLDIDIITITRRNDTEGYVLDVNYDGLDEDVAIGMLMRAVAWVTAMDCDCECCVEEAAEEEEDDE